MIAPKPIDITDLENQINQLEGQVNNLQNQIESKNDQITNLQSQIADLQSQIDDLEQLVPPLTKGTWNTIVTFTGSTYKTTDLFYIPSGTWRIRWSYTGGSLAGLSFYVYPEGETAFFVELLSATGSSKSDSTNIYNGPNNFYIKLLAANIEEWTLIIEAFIPE